MESTTILIIMTGLGIVTPFIANITQSILSNVRRSKCCGCDIEMREKVDKNNIEDTKNNIEETKKKIEEYNNIYKK